MREIPKAKLRFEIKKELTEESKEKYKREYEETSEEIREIILNLNETSPSKLMKRDKKFTKLYTKLRRNPFFEGWKRFLEEQGLIEPTKDKVIGILREAREKGISRKEICTHPRYQSAYRLWRKYAEKWGLPKTWPELEEKVLGIESEEEKKIKESIFKLREWIKTSGEITTGSLFKTKYGRYYHILHRNFGLSWREILVKVIIGKEAQQDFLKKYGKVLEYTQYINMERFVENFLKINYPEIFEKVKEQHIDEELVRFLKEWREKGFEENFGLKNEKNLEN